MKFGLLSNKVYLIMKQWPNILIIALALNGIFLSAQWRKSKYTGNTLERHTFYLWTLNHHYRLDADKSSKNGHYRH